MQLKGEITCRLIARSRIFLETMPDDLLDLRRDSWDRRRVVLQNRCHCLGGGVAEEWPPACKHLVQDSTNSENVGSMVGRPPADLLGRHVRRRAEENTRCGPSLRLVLRARRRELGQPEIQNLHVPVDGDESVFWFEITVDDTFRMRRGEPLHD